jgi:hypothetical protein
MRQRTNARCHTHRLTTYSLLLTHYYLLLAADVFGFGGTVVILAYS